MRYILKQRFFTFKDTYAIMDDKGYDHYHVRSKFFTIGKKFWISTPAGQEIFFLKQKLFHFFPHYNIIANGEVVAKAKVSPRLFKKCLKVSSDVYGDYIIKGDIFGWDFNFNKDDTVVAMTSKKIMQIADSYTIDISPSEKDYFILALAVLLDAAFRPSK